MDQNLPTDSTTVSSAKPHSKLVLAIGSIIVLLLIGAGTYLYLHRAPATQEVRSAFDDNDLDGALALTEASLAKSPSSSSLLAQKALILAQQGSLEFREAELGVQAAAAAQQAIAADPNSSEAHRALAYAYEIQQKYPDAHAEYAKAIALEPENAMAVFGDAHVYDLEGNTAKAEAGYRAALALDPNLSKGHAGLGRILVAKEDLKGALSEFALANKSTTNAREHAEASYSTGMIMLSLGQIPQAQSQFGFAIKADPTYALAWYGNGTALFASANATSSKMTLEERAKAVNASFESLSKAQSLNPNQTFVYLQLAIEHHALQHFDTARTALAEALAVVDKDITLDANAKVAVKKRIQELTVSLAPKK